MNICHVNLTTIVAILITALRAVGQTQEVQPTNKSTAITYFATQIPSCSILQEGLNLKILGDGIDRPYMVLMRKEGIKRIAFEITGAWHHGKTTNIRIVRKLYFSKYDDPSSQIIDSDRLKNIESNDVSIFEEAILKKAALTSFIRGFHRGPREGEKGSALMELFDTGWLSEYAGFLSPMLTTADSDLFRASFYGDNDTVRLILEKKQTSENDLNQALFWAAGSRYANAIIIEALLKAGANINFHEGLLGTTPLMQALATPCNVQTLVQRGANLEERNTAGYTALQIAKDANRAGAKHILESASH